MYAVLTLRLNSIASHFILAHALMPTTRLFVHLFTLNVQFVWFWKVPISERRGTQSMNYVDYG